jgi:hypothetical protein
VSCAAWNWRSFKSLEVAVLGHARGFVAIDDLLLVALEPPLPADQAGDATRDRVATHAKGVEVALFGEADVAHLLRVLFDGAGGIDLVGMGFHAVLRAQTVGLAAMLGLLIGQFALFAVLDEGLGPLAGFIAAIFVALLGLSAGSVATLLVKTRRSRLAVRGLTVESLTCCYALPLEAALFGLFAGLCDAPLYGFGRFGLAKFIRLGALGEPALGIGGFAGEPVGPSERRTALGGTARRLLHCCCTCSVCRMVPCLRVSTMFLRILSTRPQVASRRPCPILATCGSSLGKN